MVRICIAVFVLCAAGASAAFPQRVLSHRECLIEDPALPPDITRPSGESREGRQSKSLALTGPRHQPLRAERHGDIAVLYDDGRVFGPPNWRDLANITMRFEPEAGLGGGYSFSRVDLEWREPDGQPVSYEPGWPRRSLDRELPFDFPFGGETWRRISLNSTATISFGAREDEIDRPRYYKLSEFGPAQLVKERLIAALWTTTYDFDDHKVWWSVSEEEAVATWRVTETYARSQAFRKEPGYDEFQIVLRHDGVILLSYRDMNTPVGVAGVFPGQRRYAEAIPLANFIVEPRGGIPAYTDITRVWAERISPTEVRLGMELRGEPEAGRSRLFYRHFLDTTGPFAPGGLPFGEEEAVASAFWQGDRWRFRAGNVETEGEVTGREIRIIVPLNQFGPEGLTRWFADAVDFELNGAFSQFTAQVLEIAPAHEDRPVDLTNSPQRVYQGAIFEVFHAHPFRITNAGDSTRLFYDHFADTADFLVFYTSSRLDSPEGGAVASGPLAGGVSGIGIPNQWRRNTGSAGRLQAFQEVSWVDSYACEESGRSRDFGPFDSHSIAVFLNGHELGHRWGVQFDPANREGFPRISDNIHWLTEFHHPTQYCDPQTPCSSLMGGSVWEEAEPGFYMRRERNGYLQKTGYGLLDLYVMGLASPEEVGELFALTGTRPEFRPGAGHGVAAAREKFQIDSIIGAFGPRWPSAAHSQKQFNTVYVLYVMDGDELHPEHWAKVNGIREAWLDHFPAATLGRGSMTSELTERSSSQLQVAFGDHQWVETGAEVAHPINFRLLDSEGQPRAEVEVEITLEGEGELDALKYRTSSLGEVSIKVTAGSAAGALFLHARVGQDDSAKATVHVAPPVRR